MFDECKVGGIGIKGLKEIGVFGTLVGLGDEGEEEGDLELNLGNIDAVKEAVEFGAAEGGFEFGVGWGFFGKEFFGVIAGFLANPSVVSVEARRSAGEGAREGIGDGPQIGRFEITIVTFEDRVETSGAVIDLGEVFFGIGLEEVDDDGNGDDDSEGGKATEENFGDEARFRAGRFTSDGLRSPGDVVEILKVIHMIIVAGYALDAKRSMLE